MKRAVLVALMGLVFVVGGCKVEIEDHDSDKRTAAQVKGKGGKRAASKGGSFRFHSGKGGTSISIVDGDDVVELQAGGGGAHLTVKSGDDSVVLKADQLGADIAIDEKNDSVKLKATAKGARISVKSGSDHVTLDADDLHGAIKIKQGRLRQGSSRSPVAPGPTGRPSNAKKIK